MDTPGITLSEEVIDLLGDPCGHNPSRQGALELCETTEQLAALRRAVEVAQLRQLAEMVDRECSTKAIGIIAAWLHAHSELLLRDAYATVRFAVRICAHPTVLHTFADGDIGSREARFIVDFLAHPPKDLPPEGYGDAEDALLLSARGRDFEELRGTAERIRESVSAAPSPGEDLDRNLLHISKLSHGRYDIAGNLDTETGESLLSALSPFTIPRTDHDGNEDRRSAGQRNAEALGELLRRQQPGDTDTAQPPLLSITIPIEGLFANIPNKEEAIALIKAGRLDEVLAQAPMASTEWGNWISHEAARRMACDCELAVLGIDLHGAPLNINTGQRLASRKQRRALRVRDGGCAFPGCDRPASWTQAHHIIPWEQQHLTTIDNLVALCHFHHIAVHHHGWIVVMGPHRFPLFRQPYAVDPNLRWQNSQGGYVDAPPGWDHQYTAA